MNTLDLWTNGLQENFEEYLATASASRRQAIPMSHSICRRVRRDFSSTSSPAAPSRSSAPTTAGRNASYYDPNMRSPYILNWNAGFQYQLSSNMVVELTYQGSSGVGLLNRWDINQIPLNISHRLQRTGPAFGARRRTSSHGRTSDRSFTTATMATTAFIRALSSSRSDIRQGLTFTTFYTRSKAIDEDSDDAAAGGVTFYNRRLEKARSDYDVSDRWVTYATYELPFGRGRRFLANANSVVNGALRATGGWGLSRPLNPERRSDLRRRQQQRVPARHAPAGPGSRQDVRRYQIAVGPPRSLPPYCHLPGSVDRHQRLCLPGIVYARTERAQYHQRPGCAVAPVLGGKVVSVLRNA